MYIYYMLLVSFLYNLEVKNGKQFTGQALSNCTKSRLSHRIVQARIIIWSVDELHNPRGEDQENNKVWPNRHANQAKLMRNRNCMWWNHQLYLIPQWMIYNISSIGWTRAGREIDLLYSSSEQTKLCACTSITSKNIWNSNTYYPWIGQF